MSFKYRDLWGFWCLATLLITLFCLGCKAARSVGPERNSWFISQEPFAEESVSLGRGGASSPPLVELSPTIMPVSMKDDDGQFIAKLPGSILWEGVLVVLMKDYTLTAADRAAGLIVTDWKTFKYQGRLIRNKISYRQRAVTRSATYFTIENAVEELKADEDPALWVEGKDPLGEKVRILMNLAVATKQPAPKVPDQLQLVKRKYLETR